MSDPNEPPDDRKSYSDMLRYPREQDDSFDMSNWKLIGTFVYSSDSKETRFERAKGLEKI